jgi:hypothetical protein
MIRGEARSLGGGRHEKGREHCLRDTGAGVIRWDRAFFRRLLP